MVDGGLRDVVTTPERAQGFRESGLWTADTLSSRVRELARERPASVAVVDQLGARHRTYRELARDAASLAATLAGYGIARGDVVSVQLPNRYETAVAAVALNSLGAIVNPLLPNYRLLELTHVFVTARPAAVFTPATYRGFDHVALVAEAAGKAGIVPLHVVVDDAAESLPEDALDLVALLDERADDGGELSAGAGASDVSELIFTSGTEATPKAIMHTEETANFAVRQLFADLGLGAETVVWMPSPVGHSTGFNYGIRAALYHGVTLVLQDQWNAAEAAALVDAQRCNYTLAATTFLSDLVGECERSGRQLPSLTHFGCGGAPVPAPLVARAEAVGIRVLRLYGSTEVLCATWNRRDAPFDKRSTTDGYALTHTEVAVRDDDGKPLLPPAVGELYIRGPNTSVGFFGDPERTAATYLAEGWVRSGDLVHLDDDGYLSVVGRKKEIIIRGGVNIAPREIEDLIAAFPEVRQVAVVGVPDDRLGERSCACVVLEPGAQLSFTDLVERLGGTGLATYKLPESMLVLDSLPATASGKVQKHEILRRMGRS